MKNDNNSSKYYAAYDERYKTAHAHGVSWSSDVSTPIVMEVIEKYTKLMLFRSDVLKAIEEARNQKIIGKSLSAKLVINPSLETKELLNSLKADLKTVFIVSELVITDEEIEGIKFDSGIIQVTARNGIICKRCWQVVDEVNEDGICDRCENVVKKLEEE